MLNQIIVLLLSENFCLVFYHMLFDPPPPFILVRPRRTGVKKISYLLRAGIWGGGGGLKLLVR